MNLRIETCNNIISFVYVNSPVHIAMIVHDNIEIKEDDSGSICIYFYNNGRITSVFNAQSFCGYSILN